MRTLLLISILAVAGISLMILPPAVVLFAVPITGSDPGTAASAKIVFFGCLAAAFALLVVAAALFQRARDRL